MDEEKLSGILKWPVPTKVKQVQAFLGFANFYRRFIENFAKMSKLLSNQPKCWVGGQPYSRTKDHYNNNPRDLIEDKQIEKYSSKFIYLYFYYLIANILSKEKCCKLSYLLSTCTIISSMTNIIINRRFYLNFNILLLLILFYSYY